MGPHVRLAEPDREVKHPGTFCDVWFVGNRDKRPRASRTNDLGKVDLCNAPPPTSCRPPPSKHSARVPSTQSRQQKRGRRKRVGAHGHYCAKYHPLWPSRVVASMVPGSSTQLRAAHVSADIEAVNVVYSMFVAPELTVPGVGQSASSASPAAREASELFANSVRVEPEPQFVCHDVVGVDLD